MFRRIAAVVAAISMLLAACSAEPASEASPAPSARLELLLANPMANPELSFMELTSFEGSDNRADSGLVGGPTPPPPPRPSVYVTFDPVPAELVDQGLQELIEQAEAAGFENPMQGETSRIIPEGSRYEIWQINHPEDEIQILFELREDFLAVTLR